MLRKKSTMLFLISTGCLASQQTLAADCVMVNSQQQLPETSVPLTISKINLKRHDIFDLTHPKTLWFHRFANEYHVITTEPTIRDDVLFREGEQLDTEVLAETERLLRSRRYLRQAEVQVTEFCKSDQSVVVTVSTWGN